MGTLFLVGLGPGDSTYRTPQAQEALTRSDLLCGYGPYLDQIRAEFPDKETFETPMRKELERCRFALQEAETRTVSMVCSGDSGVYGMASPVLTLLPEYPGADVVGVPGITAALSGAALLGAPLGNDFCVISLSDLLTPREQIERRLQAAADGDFTIVLYNPASRRRPDHLTWAVDLLLRAGKDPQTACGWARNIGREGEASGTVSLKELRKFPADMFTTIFIGSRTTECVGGRLITPRGYQI